MGYLVLWTRLKKKLSWRPLVYYQDVWGLRTKLCALQLALSTSCVTYDIIIIVETWLNDSYINIDNIFKGYRIYRLDRNLRTSPFSRGGGVLVAVRDIFVSSLVKICVDRIEQIFVKVHFNHTACRYIRVCLFISCVWCCGVCRPLCNVPLSENNWPSQVPERRATSFRV